ncbi:NucA/NucB deoxyribonuclease domain-containing protein [Streptomyces halstedii]|uniref:NucA/NucB deoxyribonuclease domain-containing protein n=1 Tax=Streptomyces halstedii TaxID=1944 RepID=UPI0036741171
MTAAEATAAKITSPGLMAATCDITQPGSFTANRFGICMSGLVSTYTLYSDKGAVLGTGVMNVGTDMALSASKSTWDEQITVKVTSVTGQVKSLNISYDASCTGTCVMTTAVPWTGAKTLGQGQQATGKVTYNSAVARGSRTTITSKQHMYVTSTGAVPTQPNVNWDNPWAIRCDNEVSANPGCVVPDIRTNFSLSLSEFGAAAATYGWTQNALRGGAPLTRLADESAAEENRKHTCGSLSGDPFNYMDDIVPDDSCDEFPFARTYEGGTSGFLCADIVPLLEDGKWVIYEARTDKPVTGNEPCTRGHVPNTLNTNAGLALGRFAQSDRVLDTEKYNITVTN